MTNMLTSNVSKIEAGKTCFHCSLVANPEGLVSHLEIEYKRQSKQIFINLF